MKTQVRNPAIDTRQAWGFFRTHVRDYGAGCQRLPDGTLGYYPWRRVGPNYVPHMWGLAYDHETFKPLEGRTRDDVRRRVKELFGPHPETGKTFAQARGKVVRITVTTALTLLE